MSERVDATPAPLFVGAGEALPSGRLDGHLTARGGCGGLHQAVRTRASS